MRDVPCSFIIVGDDIKSSSINPLLLTPNVKSKEPLGKYLANAKLSSNVDWIWYVPPKTIFPSAWISNEFPVNYVGVGEPDKSVYICPPVPKEVSTVPSDNNLQTAKKVSEPGKIPYPPATILPSDWIFTE